MGYGLGMGQRDPVGGFGWWEERKSGQDGWKQVIEDLGHQRRSLNFVIMQSVGAMEGVTAKGDGTGEDPFGGCEWGMDVGAFKQGNRALSRVCGETFS